MQELATPYLRPRSLLGDLNCEGCEQSYWSTGVDQGSFHLTFYKSRIPWTALLNFRTVVYAHLAQLIEHIYQSPLCCPVLQRTQLIFNNLLSNILSIAEEMKHRRKNMVNSKKSFLWYQQSGRWPPSGSIAQVLKSKPTMRLMQALQISKSTQWKDTRLHYSSNVFVYT